MLSVAKNTAAPTLQEGHLLQYCTKYKLDVRYLYFTCISVSCYFIPLLHCILEVAFVLFTALHVLDSMASYFTN